MPVLFSDANLEGLRGSELVALQQVSAAVDEAEAGIRATPPVDAPRPGSSSTLSLAAAGTTLELISLALSLIESSVAASVASVDGAVREKALSALAEEASRLRVYWDRLAAAKAATAVRSGSNVAENEATNTVVGSVPADERGDQAEVATTTTVLDEASSTLPAASSAASSAAAAEQTQTQTQAKQKKKVKVKKRKRT
eukprot:CAMPEP_0170755366 /NCGR_PEP_ID=MMETSP0437-20130122/13478_1 /TAXON_ID=0 /ORGANISM="Sexangularia sp." /LENGTH=197 /DNA_ID=CAMNT_0011094527 /DNA_START=64 /DNA_END=657 /DNA_ORIENTATION=-